MITADQLYDWMMAAGVKEPAVVKLGARCIAGRWEATGELHPDGHVCGGGRVAILVMGEGPGWEAVYEAVRVGLFPVKGDPRAPVKPGTPLVAPVTSDPSPAGNPV